MRGPGFSRALCFSGFRHLSVKELIREFSTRGTLPVEIEDVIAAIRSRGISDEIYYFWDNNLDPKTLRGYIKHDEYPQPSGPPKLAVEITYAKMGHEWERLVCCKEVLHVLEPAEQRCGKPDEVDLLIEKIILPADLVDPFTDGLHAATDRAALIYAVATLFPLAARNILMPKYSNGKLTLADIEDIAELPARYVAIVMSAVWKDIHDWILAQGGE